MERGERERIQMNRAVAAPLVLPEGNGVQRQMFDAMFDQTSIM